MTANAACKFAYLHHLNNALILVKSPLFRYRLLAKTGIRYTARKDEAGYTSHKNGAGYTSCKDRVDMPSIIKFCGDNLDHHHAYLKIIKPTPLF